MKSKEEETGTEREERGGRIKGEGGGGNGFVGNMIRTCVHVIIRLYARCKLVNFYDMCLFVCCCISINFKKKLNMIRVVLLRSKSSHSLTLNMQLRYFLSWCFAEISYRQYQTFYLSHVSIKIDKH